MNKTLKRQIRLFITEKEYDELPENLRRLCERVSETYDGFDRDRRLSERSLEVSSQEMSEKSSLLESIVNSMIEGILVVNEDGRIAFHNDRFRDLWKLNQETLETRKDTDALAEAALLLKEPERFLKHVQELYEDRETSDHTLIEFKDGRILERTAVPIWSESTYLGRLWSFRDVTDERTHTEKLKARNDELEKAMRVLVGRELMMVDLKKEVQGLRKRLDARLKNHD